MVEFETAFYLGKPSDTGYCGVEVEENFFVALSTDSGMTPEEGREFLRRLKEALLDTSIAGLPDLENKVSSVIREKNPPTGFSMSLGYLKNNALYLKTIGEGEIVINRKGKVGRLLSGDASASGYHEEGDVFVFTTSRFIDILGGEGELKNVFDHKSPHQIVDEVTPRLKAENDSGAVAIFTRFISSSTSATGAVEESETIIAPRNFLERTKEELSAYYVRFGKRRVLTGITVAVLLFILLWSVGLGFQRRKSAEATEKIGLAREFITQKLTEAEETAFFNIDSAVASISEARQRLTEVKNAYPDRGEIDELENIISRTEAKVLKKEEVHATEFYDLALDNKNAKGDKLYLEGGTLLILDKTNGALYELSLSQKSLSKESVSDLKKATLVASYEGKKYFYVPGQGIYTFDDNGKVQRVVDQDKDWGVVKDLAAFNANLYLLDTGGDEVYKYAGADEGFGTKTSYFASGQSTDLFNALSFAVDGSIYIGGGSTIIKFTSGLRDGFAMNLPESEVNINRVFTSQDLESVYAWDKKKGMVYVMGKDGEFERQISSSVLTKATDLVVYEDVIYILVNGKIDKIE